MIAADQRRTGSAASSETEVLPVADWCALTLGSSLNSAASAPVPAPVMGKLEVLPFDGLSWEDFERLQWRVMHDVEGLRDAQLYGDPGQAQFGLDIVALAADGTGVALQSKKYKQFGAGELRAAVKKFRETERPFGVDRLIIGVSRIVRSTAAVEMLAELRRDLRPISLELWDAPKLSYLLRGRPAIVIEFFGKPTADAFCLPFELDVTIVPSADAVAVREAMARTPEVVTGAKVLFDEASTEADPSRALALVEAGQQKLRDARFAPFAALHDKDRVRLLAEVGRADEAARHVLDAFWAAVDQGLSTTAELTQTQLGALSKLAVGNERVQACQGVTEIATELYFNPLAQLPDPDRLRVGDDSDRLRLAVLAGETALASDDQEWLTSAQPFFAELAMLSPTDTLFHTRLRLLLAEVTSDWAGLLDDAQKLKIGHGMLGLVTARHARYLALRQNFLAADAAWDEASGDATLARQWGEASTWILSRRAFRTHFNPFTSNDLLPLQTTMREMGSSSPLVPTASGAYEDALAAHSEQRLRPAAMSAQRALRDAVATSDWAGEVRARRALASILIDADEPALAARHLARAGAGKAIEGLGESLPLSFIDNVDDLDAPNYWTIGTTFRLLAAQADLVPDDLIARIASHAVAELTESENRPDLRAFATSRYNNAIKALAGIADRLDVIHADTALSHFETQTPVDENHYRFHDKDEAVAVAKIALSQPTLAVRAVTHLTALLGRSQSARNNTTLEAIYANKPIALDPLVELAQSGNHWASETLSFGDAEQVDPATVAEALNRLVTPLQHTKGVYSVGHNAVGDSLLIRGCPAEEVDAAVSELVTRADDPHVSSSDRGDYLLAAANLSDHVTESSRSGFFAAAMRLATSPAPSEHDALNAQFTHKLGGIRMNGNPRESRGQALLLASEFADDDSQRNDVRRLVYSLLGRESDYWPTRALQHLGDTVKDDLAFLASQGWAIRNLAAILWVDHGEPDHLGNRLASDPDVRVRRALADALAKRPDALYPEVREQLAADPAYSVRTALGRRVSPQGQ